MEREIKDYSSSIQYNFINREICFINPSIGIPIPKRVDLLRTYLTFGTLISALTSRYFLRQFAIRKKKDEFIFHSDESYPYFDINIISLDLKGRKSVYEFLEYFFRKYKSNPIMICTTATSLQFEEVKEVALAAKQLKPHSLRIIGGPHVSVTPLKSLKESEFQVVCIGEGVETITELALNCIFGRGQKTLCEISGIAYKDKNNQVYKNKDRQYILSLDEYPHPSKSLSRFVTDLNDYLKNSKYIIYILGGFGCPFNCAFCAQNEIHKGKIRERSANNIFTEIKNLYFKGFRKFAIVQETFTGNKERIDIFCNLIKESSINIEWTAESRIDQINYSQLKKMKKSGLKLIQIGLESGDQNLLDYICKRIKINDAIKLINKLKKLKIDTTIYLLVGLPKQDWQSIFKTALFFLKYTPYNTLTMHVSTSITIPYPGTKILKEKLVLFKKNLSNRTKGQQWQSRKPKVYVNERGEFIGENYTATEVMTSKEILEALIYLDDFCYSVLHSKYDSSLSDGGRIRFSEYANKMMYMIERRTIRDLIIQARSSINYENKQEILNEFKILDRGKETHFKDITKSIEESPQIFRDFLANITFVNGFYIMRSFSVSKRIKWMKFCCILWDSSRRSFDKFCFQRDTSNRGKFLNKKLCEINNKELSQRLKNSKTISYKNLAVDRLVNRCLLILGIRFYIVKRVGIFK